MYEGAEDAHFRDGRARGLERLVRRKLVMEATSWFRMKRMRVCARSRGVEVVVCLEWEAVGGWGKVEEGSAASG